MVYDTIILGAGIAGITAAIYASRKKMNYLIIAEDFGGQVNIAGEIENYPGIPKTNWSEFKDSLEKQLEYNNIKINYESVKEVKKEKKYFIVRTNKKFYKTKTVIICTGARARELNVPGEKKLQGRGVTYCAICDGPLFKNKTVAVIGGGNSAMEAVDYLQKISKKIYLININPKLEGYEYLIEKVKKAKNVKIINNAKTTKITGYKVVNGLEYEQKGKLKKLKVQGVFVEIGRIPNTESFKNSLKIDKHSHIIIDKHAQTSVPGVFAAGDCTDLHSYQFITAAGQGCTALLSAVKYLQKLHHKL